MTFLIKKTITLIVMPLCAALALMWAGLILRKIHRLKRVSVLLAAAGTVALTVLSLQPVANEVIKPLEMCYPPLVEFDGLRHVKWVVVLGGGHASNPDRPANLQIGTSTLARLVEGLRVLSHLPESRLLLSGGAVFDPVPEAAGGLASDGQTRILDKVAGDIHERTPLYIGNRECVEAIERVLAG